MVIVWEDDFKIPIYKQYIKLIITNNIPLWIEEAGITPTEDPRRSGAIILNCLDIPSIPVDFIILFDIDCLYEGKVAHESLHLTAQIMREIGMPLTIDSEEAYAYLIEYISNVIRKKLIKYKQSNGYTNT